MTGGGTGHLPLFLWGEGMLDGCGVGQRVSVAFCGTDLPDIQRRSRQGAGVLYLYGNYTGDIMNF